MAVQIRTIKPDEAVAFRRAVRQGFYVAETADDAEWATAILDDVDRAYAAFDGNAIVATLRSFRTDVTVPGGATVSAGALTAVTCRSTHRRQGLLTRMISADLSASKELGEPLDVLIASEYPIYGRFGYGPATVHAKWELDTSRTQFREAGQGSIEYVDNETFRKEAPAVFERVRRARPGMITRNELRWDVLSDVRRAPEEKPWNGFRVLCRDADGVAQGWASFKTDDNWTDRQPKMTASVPDMCAATPAAEARLWQFLADLDLVLAVAAEDRPDDELLPFLLTNARAAKQVESGDFVWARLLDVPAALEARSYETPGRVAFEVTDELGLAGGRFVLDASVDGATCSPTHETAELTLPVQTLGAAYLGGTRLATVARAGWLDEHADGAVARADALLAGAITPWCNTWF